MTRGEFMKDEVPLLKKSSSRSCKKEVVGVRSGGGVSIVFVESF